MSNVQPDKSKPVTRRYLSVSRIAREIDSCDGYVHKLIRAGELVAVRRGRMVRITVESYQKFLASLKGQPKTAA